MNATERAEVSVAAALLHAAEKTWWFSAVLSLLGAVTFILDIGWQGAAAVVLGLVTTYYRIRISFDAQLLDQVVAETLATPDLDQALIALSLARASRAGRSWTDRCRGTKRLVMIYALALALQTLSVMLIGR